MFKGLSMEFHHSVSWDFEKPLNFGNLTSLVSAINLPGWWYFEKNHKCTLKIAGLFENFFIQSICLCLVIEINTKDILLGIKVPIRLINIDRFCPIKINQKSVHFEFPSLFFERTTLSTPMELTIRKRHWMNTNSWNSSQEIW